MTEAAVHKSGTELLARVAAGLAMAAIAIVMVFLGGRYFWALVALGAMLMAGEWAALVSNWKHGEPAAFVAMGAVLLLAWPGLGLSEAATWAGLAACVVALALVSRRPAIAAGIAYIGIPALALLYLRDQSDGTELTVWTIAVVCITDTGAYFVGRAIGGPKLAPRLSPSKTWAGLLGGMTAALIAGVGLAYLLHLPFRLGALGAALAVAAQAGDLFESWLKRRAGVKDSGRLLPGHGGVFDRLDGLVPVASIVPALIALGWF